MPTRTKLPARQKPMRHPGRTRQRAALPTPAPISPFAHLFASETLVALLKLFLLNQEQSYYQSQLVSLTGGRLYLVQRELARLERAGLVVKDPSGNRVYYRLNRNHPVVEDLKRVFLKTVALGDMLRTALAPLADRVKVAFIYGSYARGEEREHSDVDLFIIGDLKGREAADAFAPVGRELGRELNRAIFPVDEFREKAQSGHYFIEDVLCNPKLFLIGGESELRELADRQAAT